MINRKRLHKEHRRKERGFTMIELGLVFIIGGFITAALFNLGQSFRDSTKERMTKLRVETIEEALIRHIHRRGDLPCPARRDLLKSDANYGLEHITNAADNSCLDPAALYTSVPGMAMTSGTDLGSDYNGDTITDPEPIAIGLVPIETLGLPHEFMEDGWGKAFTYMVTANETNGTVNEASGAITILDANGREVTRRPGSGIYAIISHGKNGVGSYGTGGGGLVACGPTGVGDPRENENCDDDGTITAGNYSLATGANLMDDNVLYRPFLPEFNENPCNAKMAFFIPDHPSRDVDGCVGSKLALVAWETFPLDCTQPGTGTGTGDVLGPGTSEDCATRNYSYTDLSYNGGGAPIAPTDGLSLFSQNITAIDDGYVKVRIVVPIRFQNSAGNNWENALQMAIFVENITDGTPPVLANAGDIVNPQSDVGGVTTTGGTVGIMLAEAPILRDKVYNVNITIFALSSSSASGGWAGTIRTDDDFVTSVVDIFQVADTGP